MMQIKNQFTKDVKYHGLFWAVAILIITLLFWAGFSKVDQVTVAGGKVIPDKKVQVIQHKDGGILSEIFVHEGQRVKKGEVLAQIDSKEYKSQYNQGKSQEADLKLTTFRLRALLDGVSFDPKKIPGYKTYNKKLLDTQKALYDALKSENIAKKMVFSQKIKTKEQETSLAKERLKYLTQAKSLVNQELMISKPLYKQGALSQMEFIKVSQQANKLNGEFSEASLLVKKSQQSLKEAKHQKVEFERSYHRDLIDKLNSTEAKLIEIRHENERLLAKSNRTMIKSPVSGVIKVINVNTIGASITPGMSILEVVPTDGVLMIESKVRPQDVAHLRPGMQAVVKLSAYDYLIYGTLKGKLINLSADTITDDKGNTFYSAYVKVNKNQDNIELSKMDLIPGMIAEVDLVSGKRSILSYLLKPLLKTKHKALREY